MINSKSLNSTAKSHVQPQAMEQAVEIEKDIVQKARAVFKNGGVWGIIVPLAEIPVGLVHPEEFGSLAGERILNSIPGRRLTWWAGRKTLLAVIQVILGKTCDEARELMQAGTASGNHGKPYFINDELGFSISHSGDRLFMTVSRTSASVDTELLQVRKSYNAVLERMLTPWERSFVTQSTFSPWVELWAAEGLKNSIEIKCNASVSAGADADINKSSTAEESESAEYLKTQKEPVREEAVLEPLGDKVQMQELQDPVQSALLHNDDNVYDYVSESKDMYWGQGSYKEALRRFKERFAGGEALFTELSRFFMLWTVKETAVKLTGRGLVGLNEFEFRLEEGYVLHAKTQGFIQSTVINGESGTYGLSWYLPEVDGKVASQYWCEYSVKNGRFMELNPPKIAKSLVLGLCEASK